VSRNLIAGLNRNTSRSPVEKVVRCMDVPPLKNRLYPASTPRLVTGTIIDRPIASCLHSVVYGLHNLFVYFVLGALIAVWS
jgi:hypothetical protein